MAAEPEPVAVVAEPRRLAAELAELVRRLQALAERAEAARRGHPAPAGAEGDDGAFEWERDEGVGLG